ncbi:MAG TPA: ferrous iron transport protein B, partial [Pirellulales bacterium]
MPAPSASDSPVPVVALIGNPNTGKSTLFNALCGGGARTGNYPGCTVEEKTGRASLDGRPLLFVDLPGTYSLAPRSRDEMAAVDVLLGRLGKLKPNVVVCIVDATNLERNLYLVSQVLELGLPTVVAVNMVDAAKERGVEIDLEKLAAQLAVPIVPTVAHRAQGLPELKRALLAAAERGPTAAPASPFPEAFQQEVGQLHALLNPGPSPERTPRFLVERLLLDVSNYLEGVVEAPPGVNLAATVAEARTRLKAAGAPIPAVEAISRYKWVGQVLSGVVKRPSQRRETFGDRVDRWLTHQWVGTLVFAALMFVVFQAIYAWSEPMMSWIETGQGWVQETVGAQLAEGPIKSLIVDGILAGVGGVVIFLPQILVLFLFIGLLEDCGYMARVAFLMDKIMSRVGLSGKSFIPLLSSFACAVPGIMAARVIENSRDRLATILIAPLMSCSARLPVYTILIAAFIPQIYLLGTINVGGGEMGLIDLRGVVMFSMYVVGIVAAIGMAWLLKKTILRGDAPPFVLELPTYKWPSIANVLRRMLDRGW